MPRGRPKIAVAPCRYCNKQFKRQEHLVRHERTRKTVLVGMTKDLLARHARLSHQLRPEAPQAPMTHDAAEVSVGDLDFFWDPNFTVQDMLPATLFDIDFSLVNPPPSIHPTKRCNFSWFTSRLPRLDDSEDDSDGEVADDSGAGDQAVGAVSTINLVPWSVTELDYERLCLEVQSYSGILPTGCVMLSKHTLTRHLEVYLRCVQSFLPFIHVATFQVGQKDIELLLAMAALGSLYRYESAKPYELYFMAKAILMEKIRQESLQLTSDLLSRQTRSNPNQRNSLEKAQTLILLISFASWAGKDVLPDALSMGSQLAMLVRENQISASDEMPHDIDWLTWVAIEGKRRTLLSACVLFNLHSIAFDIPPLILNHEVGLFLPGCSGQWESKDAAEWLRAPRQVEHRFQEGLNSLFSGTGIPKDASVSSFSNYLLIHGLLQQIYIDRHSTGSLQPETVESFETALRAWQASWELTGESTLDPSSPKGPFGLSAIALLRLAYIRLNSDLRPCPWLLTNDIRCVTGEHSCVDRSTQLDKAVLHAAHALSIPVRLGIGVMARGNTPIWTIEHSLCSLECARLLKDWLGMISTIMGSYGTGGLRKAEKTLLEIVDGIIKETYLAETLDVLEDDASRVQRMASIAFMFLRLTT
ncbi:hypothetical protein AAE478_009379 [Parahypoxylon ruwenzoriense]